MRKTAILLCALVLFCALPASAAEYPASRGAATDLAEVLSGETIEDLQTLSERYDDAVGGKLCVLTRHFLGGEDVYDYAKGLFSAWALGEYDALLVLVVGEETYALQLGDGAADALPSESRAVLLGSHFREKYLSRDYDGATGDLMTRLAERLAGARGESLSAAGLFGAAGSKSGGTDSAAAGNGGNLSDLWNGLFSSAYETADVEAVDENTFEREDEKTGFSFKRLLIFAIIIYFIFFRKKRRRFNFGHRR